MKPLLVVDPAKCSFEERVWLFQDGFQIMDTLLDGGRTASGGSRFHAVAMKQFRLREATQRLRRFKEATGL